jgi:tetratricopeptide (TPR) repeat protein
VSLRLSGGLSWQPAGSSPQELPVTLASAVLLVLARRGEWVARADLAELFWPGQPPRSALAGLRVQLHRARALVAGLRQAPALQSERRRVRWAPDVVAAEGGAALAAGFDLPGFEAFDTWLRAWRASVGGAAGTGSAEAAPAEPERQGFHGRRAELMELRRMDRPVCVVAGEAGIGKSRLVGEAFPSAPWLRCQPGLMSVPFGAVAQLFTAQPQWLRDLGSYRLDVARLLPELAPDEPLPPLDAITARVRLFEGLARCVEAHCERLVADDLQWADAATLDWLRQLAHRGRTRWVATLRLDEAPPATAAALQALECAGLACLLPLDGLDAAALAEMLQARRPDIGLPPGRLSVWGRALARHTGGNAFCAIEVLDALDPAEAPEQLGRRAAPQRVATLLRSRLGALPAPARALVQAAALALGKPAPAQLAAMAGLDEDAAVAALEQAQRHGLLVDTRCRHDLVREAVRAATGPARAAALHRRAARQLAAERAEPELVAYHWREAGEPGRAWPYVLRAAQRLRVRGEHAAAVAELEAIRRHCADAALALHAQILLAQERLFDDLGAGRQALQAALDQAAGLRPGAARRELQARALAGLVDNAVFSGELPRARELAVRLRRHLAGLPAELRVEAHQVLIEVAMREPDIAAARASLQALREAGAPPPVVASFEAQIHWFGGAVREARGAFERLLDEHPDYCRGLTIENDLAVMCHALGDLPRAEAMARRSLDSWRGLAHTETLSLLVLGAVLTSAGRFEPARAALEQALALGRQQGSALFAGEALARLARMHGCAGDTDAAREAAAQAWAAVGDTAEPLRLSALVLVAALSAPNDAATRQALARLVPAAERCGHPLALARRWRAQAALCEADGDRAGALAAARQMEAVADRASLAEWRCEALCLQARLAVGEAAQRVRQAAAQLAAERGFGWLAPERVAIRPAARRQAAA